MATITFKNRLRTDQRTTVEPSPVWITSGWFDYTDAGKGACLFLFELKAGNHVVIHGAAIEVIEAFAGGTPTIDLGLGSVAYGERHIEDNVNITITDADEFVPNADVTASNAGLYPALTGASVTLWAAGKAPIITCDDDTIPCIYATLSASLTAGKARAHVLMSVLPSA